MHRIKSPTLILIILTILTALTLNISDSHGISASAYSIPLQRYSSSIYKDRVSIYTLTSSDSNFSLPDSSFQKVLKRNCSREKCRITYSTTWIP